MSNITSKTPPRDPLSQYTVSAQRFVGDPRYAAQVCTCYSTRSSELPLTHENLGYVEVSPDIFICLCCHVAYTRKSSGQQPTAPERCSDSSQPDQEIIDLMEQRLLEQESGIDLFWEYLAANYPPTT